MFLYPLFLFAFSFFLQTAKYKKTLLSLLCIALIYLAGRDFGERLAYYAPFQGLKYAGAANFSRLGRVLGGGEEGRKYKSFEELLRIINDDGSDRKIGILAGYLLEGNNWQESLKSIDRLEREYRFIFFYAFREKIYDLMRRAGQNIKFDDFMHYVLHNSAKIKNAADKYPDKYREQLIYESMGIYSGRYDNLKYVLGRAGDLSGERISNICKGYGYYIGYDLCKESDFLENLKEKKEKVDFIFHTIEQLFSVRLAGLPERWKGYVYLGYMEGIKQSGTYEMEDSMYVTPLDITYYYNYINSSAEEFYRPFIYYGIGVRFGRDIIYDDVHRILFFSDKISGKYGKYFYNGLGEGASYVLHSRSEILEIIIGKIPERYKRFFWDGMSRNRTSLSNLSNRE